MEADAFNSLGDFGYSGLLLLGFEILLRPKDETHPHGHERFEPFISLMVACAIGLTGIFIVGRAIQSFFNPVYSFAPHLVIALFVSIVTKCWLSLFMKRKANEMDSTALMASSEDARVDVLASLTALVGVFGAWYGFLFFDVIVGIIVSGWIFKTALSIGWRSFRFLTGAAAPKETLKQIQEILDVKEEIISSRDLEAHYVGPEIHVSLSIHLPEDLSFRRVHEIEEELRGEIASVRGVDAVYLHMEPKVSKTR